MLAEWLLYATTRCPGYVRRDGYLREAIGLWSRSRRQRLAWQSHLEMSQRVVRDAIAGLEQKRKLLVIGSGLLLDLPLAELSRQFAQVILVDIVHLPVAIWSARHYPNVEFRQCDVTGLGDLQLADRQVKSVPPASMLSEPDVDLVISLNILSQLPLVPLEHFERRFGFGEAESANLVVDLIEAHLEWLRRFPCRVALICDRERLTLSPAGAVLERDDALFGAKFPLEIGSAGREWFWDVAPVGEWEADRAVRNRVFGIPDLRSIASGE